MRLLRALDWDRSDAARWSRADAFGLALVLAVAAGCLPFLVHPWYDRTNDGSMYLLAARALGAGEGYTYLGEPFSVRPPGLSALLVPFVRGPELDFRAINALVAAFGAALVALFFVHNRARLGWLPALAAALLVWALPGFQRLCNQVMSDVPGAALLFVCILVERWSARRPSRGREVLLGLCIGLSAYVRTVLLLLVPAILASRLLRRRSASDAEAPPAPRGLFLFAAVALAVALPWTVRNRIHPPPAPADQVFLHSVGTLLWHADPRDPASPRVGAGEVLARIPSSARGAVEALGTLRLTRPLTEPTEPPGKTRTFAGLALFACLAIALVRRREPGEIFVAGSLFVLFLFPTQFLERYALPVFLFALPAAVELARDALCFTGRPRLAQVATGAALLALAALVFEPRRDWNRLERRHSLLTRLCDRIGEHLRPDTRACAPTGWHLSLFLDRPVHSLRSAVLQAGIEAGTESTIEKYGLNTVILTPIAEDFPDPLIQGLMDYVSGRSSDLAPFSLAGKPVLVARVRP